MQEWRCSKLTLGSPASSSARKSTPSLWNSRKFAESEAGFQVLTNRMSSEHNSRTVVHERALLNLNPDKPPPRNFTDAIIMHRGNYVIGSAAGHVKVEGIIR